MSPVRVQRRRVKSWRNAADAIYVGRPTKWGNPFRVGDPFPKRNVSSDPSLRGLAMNAYDVVALYRRWLKRRLVEDPTFLEPLRGHDLACWCDPDAGCHADVLLEYLEDAS
jgi:hypothetical protein